MDTVNQSAPRMPAPGLHLRPDSELVMPDTYGHERVDEFSEVWEVVMDHAFGYPPSAGWFGAVLDESGGGTKQRNGLNAIPAIYVRLFLDGQRLWWSSADKSKISSERVWAAHRLRWFRDCFSHAHQRVRVWIEFTSFRY